MQVNYFEIDQWKPAFNENKENKLYKEKSSDLPGMPFQHGI